MGTDGRPLLLTSESRDKNYGKQAMVGNVVCLLLTMAT